MGLFDKIVKALGMKKIQVNILVVGLNNSGKSTIVSHFKNPDERSTISVPTVGFQIEQFESTYELIMEFPLSLFIFCFVVFFERNVGENYF